MHHDLHTPEYISTAPLKRAQRAVGVHLVLGLANGLERIGTPLLVAGKAQNIQPRVGEPLLRTEKIGGRPLPGYTTASPPLTSSLRRSWLLMSPEEHQIY